MEKLPTLLEIKLALCIDHYMGSDDLTSEEILSLLEATVLTEESDFPDGIYPCECYEDFTPDGILDAINDMACSVRSYLETLLTKETQL